MHAFVFEVDDNFNVAHCADVMMSIAKSRNAASRQSRGSREFALFYTKDRGRTIQAMDGLLSVQISKESLLKSYNPVTPIGSMPFISDWSGQKSLQFVPGESMPKCLISKDKSRKMVFCSGKQFASRTRGFRGRYLYLFRIDKSICRVAFIRKGKDGKKDIINYFGTNAMSMKFLAVEDCVFVAEWRAFVLDGKVQSIRPYRGERDIKPDVEEIKRLAAEVSASKEYPESFIMDIGLAEDDKGNRSTLVMGAAPFICCKLYGAYFDTMLEMAEKSFVVNA